MRWTILLSVSALFAVTVAGGVANDACAQHRDGAGPGWARSGNAVHGARGHGISHARGGHHGFGHDRNRRAEGRSQRGYAQNRARVISPYGFGYGYLPDDTGLAYDSGATYTDQEPQQVVYVQPPPVTEQKPAPPAVEPPAASLIKEYKWPPADRASSRSSSEPQVFAIVLKDGSTLSAVSVYASDNSLHFVDPGERHLRVSMSEVDRGATLRLNRARDLNLYLPAAE
jgi:hypothetical protein